MTTTPTSTRARSKRAARVAELDASTPRWPEIALALTDPASITVSGVTTALTGDDPQRQAVVLAARHAANHGGAVRMRVTTPGGVHRVIVTADHRVVPLDTNPAPAGAAPAPPKTPRQPSRKAPGAAAAGVPAGGGPVPPPGALGRPGAGRAHRGGAGGDRRARQIDGGRGHRARPGAGAAAR